MNRIGVSLVDVKSGQELQTWESMPRVITHGGEDRTGATIGAQFSGEALLVARVCEPAPFGSPPVLAEEAQFDGEKVVVARQYGEPDLAPIKAALVAQVKAEAGSRILSYCPQYKQANLTARAAEIAMTYPGTAGADLPEPYNSEWVAGLAIWTHIKEIRSHSDTLEAEITGIATAAELEAWKSHDWPGA